MLARTKQLATPLNVALAYLALVFALGGGARDDIASLAILRPVSVGVLLYAITVASPSRIRANRVLLGFAGTWVLLVAAHLVPLPPAIWQNLPGRELAVAIDQTAGLGDRWRPLSLVPYRTLNSLLSLTVPLAALMLAINLKRDELRVTAIALIALAGMSALFSLLQTAGGAGNGFYLYRITNSDSAVGLFANRNHNAIALALAIAMLGAMRVLVRPPRELKRFWGWLTFGGALALIPFLVITQSRAGLLLGVFALAAHWWLARSHDSAPQRRMRASLAALGAIAGAAILAALTWAFAGGSAVSRLARGSADGELRIDIWPVAFEQALAHFPVGSGIGTFVEVYEVAEPSSTLGASYINHAHNDWLEVAMTGGLPALLLLLAAAVWLAHAGLRSLREAEGRDLVLRRAGLVTLAILALGSAYDYPLRTPSLAVQFILALVWIAGRSPVVSNRAGSNARPRTETASNAAPAI